MIQNNVYLIYQNEQIETMKTQILNTQNIETTEFTMESNIITLDSVPTIEEQEELFGDDDSIVLEF